MFCSPAVLAILDYKWASYGKLLFRGLTLIYLMFLASFVAWSSITEEEHEATKSALVYVLLFFVVILLLVETRQIHCDGIEEYCRDKFQVRRRIIVKKARFSQPLPRRYLE